MQPHVPPIFSIVLQCHLFSFIHGIMDGSYRIQNYLQGRMRTLAPFDGRLPYMAVTAVNDVNQVWTVTNHPYLSNVVKLTSQLKFSLCLAPLGSMSPFFISSLSENSSVWFEVVPYPNNQGIWRLDGLGAPNRCLGVRTKFQTELQSMHREDYSGNYWIFSRLKDGEADQIESSKAKFFSKLFQNSSVPDGRYRVYNYYQGLVRSLTDFVDPIMSRTQIGASNQIWTILNHPSKPNLIKLISHGRRTLLLSNENKPSLTVDSNSWLLLGHSPDTPKIWRLEMEDFPQICMGVISMNQSLLNPLPSEDLAGNYWIFENAANEIQASSLENLSNGKSNQLIKKSGKPLYEAAALEMHLYRVANLYQGLCRSLSGSKMVKTERKIDQFWTLTRHRTIKNVVRLTASTGQNLRLPLGGQPGLSFGNDSRNSVDGWFYLVTIPLSSEANLYRLVSLADSQSCLSVQSMSSSELKSVSNLDRIQNYWVLEPVEQLVQIPPQFHYFYRKYINLHGISILSSAAVPDSAIYQAYFISRHMLSVTTGVISTMVSNGAKFAVIGAEEETTDIPAHRFLNATYWNARARGLGATLDIPTSSCTEENLLCYQFDKYVQEDITIHEFAHSMQNLGLNLAVPGFGRIVEKLYRKAVRNGKYQNTYARKNSVEYFAEGVQGWFSVNVFANPPDGLHNEVNNRAALKEYDPDLYDLLARYFPTDANKCSCH